MTTLLAAAHFLSPPAAVWCPAGILAVHSQTGSLLAESSHPFSVVGWLHSRTWDRYKRTSLGTKCWQRDGINTKPFASNREGRMIRASSPSADELLLLSCFKCSDLRDPLRGHVLERHGLEIADLKIFLLAL